MSKEEDIKKVKDTIATKWKNPCPMCGGKRFGVGTDVSALIRYEKNPTTGLVDIYSTANVIPVVCADCGYIMLVTPDER